MGGCCGFVIESGGLEGMNRIQLTRQLVLHMSDFEIQLQSRFEAGVSSTYAALVPRASSTYLRHLGFESGFHRDFSEFVKV
jgi:hypothetical protein